MINRITESITARSILFTLTKIIMAVRKILVEDFEMSEQRANTCILIAIDAEKRCQSEKEGEDDDGNKS